MKADLLKYKHYLSLLLALLLANYLLMPLTLLQTEQQQTFQLLKKKQKKTETLISNSDAFVQKDEVLALYLKKSHGYLFAQQSEAKFKLSAQTQIEKLLENSGCTIARIGFKGKQQVFPEVQKWYMEIRYSGDVVCLMKATRALETAKPYINIEEYSYRAKAFDKDVDAKSSAILKVSVWYKASEITLNNEKG